MKALMLSSVLLTLTACATSPAPAAPALSLQVMPNPITVGRELKLNLTLQHEPGLWYVLLLVESPDGQVDQLLPNRLPGGAGTLKAGQTVVFPAPEANILLKATAPAGVHTVLAYASPRPLNLEGISAYASESAAFATVQANRQGVGGLEGSTTAIIKLLNPGIATLAKFTVTAQP
ncbi:DUF4384 domain-containing protein [Deinococcus sp. QL22]|uniref:DUF4384 domain-containing protein n=1 Tax=Deinococcus sp. QL22 TaxID=2939437 RepID=UPI0020171988|nr:DUF4384 domain-containing protein [Deinococcus sp. QL22]UQN10644.1 DUF4384 domain-containing protein [Deinococcus sp. QL22]